MAGKENKLVSLRKVIAESLKSQRVEYVFGVVGYPIIELGFACQRAGLKYVGMRNEQSASYAAAAIGYLTGRPGACLVVPGPGVVHALAGLANASSNGWPCICIAGSSEVSQDGLGAFQESLPPQGGAQLQLQYAASGMCKYAAKVTKAERTPFYIEQAVRYAINGRPGGAYIEIAGDTLREKVGGVQYPPKCLDPPMVFANPADVDRAMAVLANATSPLIIVGKGAAYAGAGRELLTIVEQTKIPFLPTPMGKGCLPDDHPLCMSSARSYALKHADAILLVGARLNWILHYGRSPRYRNGVKFIHIELLPEEVGASVRPEVALVGDAKAILSQVLDRLPKSNIAVSPETAWMRGLREKSMKSRALFEELSSNRSKPLNYYCALGIIDKYIPRDATVMNEGSDTMDIGRTVLNNYSPRSRLDAGTWGTMGVGMGQAIAAALVNPDPGCLAVFGDSAFGFSGMEFETICRLQLPVVCIILNNNGIGAGNPTKWTNLKGQELAGRSTLERLSYPSKSLTPSARYEKVANAFGATGVYVDTADGLEDAIRKAMSVRPFVPQIINCQISTTASRGKKSAPPWAAAKL